MTRDVRDVVKKDEADIIATIRATGGCAQSYRRERRRAIKAMVSDVYSPPRVTAACKLLPELKIIPSFAFDLTTADADGRSGTSMRRRCGIALSDECVVSSQCY